VDSSTLFQQHLHSLCTGSTALGIKASKLCLLRVVLPPMKEQEEITEFLNSVFAKYSNPR
jgi:type I restriction enzyme S subunit